MRRQQQVHKYRSLMETTFASFTRRLLTTRRLCLLHHPVARFVMISASRKVREIFTLIIGKLLFFLQTRIRQDAFVALPLTLRLYREQNQAQILIFTDRDERLFFLAATTNNTKQVAHYLANKMSINVVDQYGWTALMMAAAEGATSVVRLLLTHNADASQTANGKTAEDLAAQKDRFDVLQAFEEHRYV